MKRIYERINGTAVLLPASLPSRTATFILVMQRRYALPVGLSDHTDGIVAAVTSVALGAKVIEKHIRIDDIGLDGFAAYPEPFKVMVEVIRATEKALGKVAYGGEKRFRREKVEDKWMRVTESQKEKSANSKAS